MYSDSTEYLKYLAQQKILISTEDISYNKINEVVLNTNLNY